MERGRKAKQLDEGGWERTDSTVTESIGLVSTCQRHVIVRGAHDEGMYDCEKALIEIPAFYGKGQVADAMANASEESFRCGGVRCKPKVIKR